MHHQSAEHRVVVKGTAEATNGDRVMILSGHQYTFIPLGHVHRMADLGKVPLGIIDVQSGSHFGKNDIARIEDTYGRIRMLIDPALEPNLP